jgi:putative nucleotidyltransferase with HDIG domain
MENIQRIKIPVSKVQPGMKISEDIYTPKGLMLIPKNTILDEKHIFRIKLYQIMTVFIAVSEDNPLTPDTVKDVVKASFEFEITQNFNDFKERYLVHHELTEQKLSAINAGELINEEDLYEVSTVLIDSLRTKSDLFNYMYHLREEDDYTYTHCLNVSILSNIFAKWLKLSEDQIKEVTIAGLLHDVGKMKIDNHILNKPSKLTFEEFEIIKKHTTLGYETIKEQSINNTIKSGVLFHHEKMDGSGYPLGIKQDQIPLYAKIIGIVDIYDAMTSKRSYHDRFSPFKVIRMFEQESYGLLDTKLLFVFLENIAYNYLGKDVLLSTGERARIVFIHNQSPSRPIVQINERMVDLMFEPGITIEEIL